MHAISHKNAGLCLQPLNKVQGIENHHQQENGKWKTETGAARAWGHREVSNGIFMLLLTRDAIHTHMHTHTYCSYHAIFACFLGNFHIVFC